VQRHTLAGNNFSRPKVEDLRSELALLRSRYDAGAVPLAVYRVIRGLEVELAWLEPARPA
jgi:hypothetical protein